MLEGLDSFSELPEGLDFFKEKYILENNKEIQLKDFSIVDYTMLFRGLPDVLLDQILVIEGVNSTIKKRLIGVFRRHYFALSLLLSAYFQNKFRVELQQLEEIFPMADLLIARFELLKVIHAKIPELQRLLTVEALWFACEIDQCFYALKSSGLTDSPLLEEDGTRVLSKTKLLDNWRKTQKLFVEELEFGENFERITKTVGPGDHVLVEVLLNEARKYSEKTSDEDMVIACRAYYKACSEFHREIGKGKNAEKYQLYYLNSLDNLVVTGKGRRIPKFQGYSPRKSSGRPRKNPSSNPDGSSEDEII
jgi:hypothetical protein